MSSFNGFNICFHLSAASVPETDKRPIDVLQDSLKAVKEGELWKLLTFFKFEFVFEWLKLAGNFNLFMFWIFKFELLYFSKD